jgi:FkbM family methyltransferase
MKKMPEHYIDLFVTDLEAHLGIGCGGNETSILKTVAELSNSPLTILDVGANKGQYTGLALSTIPAECLAAIHCFEPSQSAREEFVKNEFRTGLVHLHPYAVSSSVGRSSLFADEAGSELASLHRRKLDHFQIMHGQHQETVNLTTIDSFCDTNEIEQVHLLKLDIEGHELSALEGAQRIFTEDRVDCVQFEFGGCNIDSGTHLQDFFYWFKDRRFTLFRSLPSGRFLRIANYSEVDEKPRHSLFLAVSDRFDFCRRFHDSIIFRNPSMRKKPNGEISSNASETPD